MLVLHCRAWSLKNGSLRPTTKPQTENWLTRKRKITTTTREQPCCLETKEDATRLAISVLLPETKRLRHDLFLSKILVAEKCLSASGHRCLRDEGAWAGVAGRVINYHLDVDIHIQSDAYRDLHIRAESIQHDIANSSSNLSTSEVSVWDQIHGIIKTSMVNNDTNRRRTQRRHEGMRDGCTSIGLGKKNQKAAYWERRFGFPYKN